MDIEGACGRETKTGMRRLGRWVGGGVGERYKGKKNVYFSTVIGRKRMSGHWCPGGSIWMGKVCILERSPWELDGE